MNNLLEYSTKRWLMMDLGHYCFVRVWQIFRTQLLILKGGLEPVKDGFPG
jgi:hypothetical protein